MTRNHGTKLPVSKLRHLKGRWTSLSSIVHNTALYANSLFCLNLFKSYCSEVIYKKSCSIFFKVWQILKETSVINWKFPLSWPFCMYMSCCLGRRYCIPKEVRDVYFTKVPGQIENRTHNFDRLELNDFFPRAQRNNPSKYNFLRFKAHHSHVTIKF